MGVLEAFLGTKLGATTSKENGAIDLMAFNMFTFWRSREIAGGAIQHIPNWNGLSDKDRDNWKQMARDGYIALREAITPEILAYAQSLDTEADYAE